MSGVLVTGGTGKTGRVVVERLRGRGVPVRVASRHPSPDGVAFDWADVDTHRAALTGMVGVYLVPPPLCSDPVPLVEPFLAEADRAGVRRVVLLGSAIVIPGSPELAALVRERPGWAVLRPSAFMQNFLRPHPMAVRIRRDGEILTSAGTGRVGWIDAVDIAEAAAVLLGDLDVDHGDDHLLTGPTALSYRDAAAIITAETGRAVRVLDVGVDEVAASNRAAGMPASFAQSLAALEADIEAGLADEISTAVLDLTGRPPRGFADFVREHAEEWAAP